MGQKIRNGHIAISVSKIGAELQSLIRVRDQRQFLWDGNPQYWEGQSPILFPTVGRVFNDTIKCEGQNYPMPKHGLVKDMEFEIEEVTKDTITLSVSNDLTTIKSYPFPFLFKVKYQLKENTLVVNFEIVNTGSKPLPFHLGAHPAFCLPQFNEQDEIHGYVGFDIHDQLISNGIRPGGFLWPEGSFPVKLDEHDTLPLQNHTFDCDTILDSRGIARACTLYNRNREAIVTVRFNSPILAMWAPCGGKSPFVCIEPWWGCCDEVGYADEFTRRPWTNIVKAGESKTISYSITVH